MPFDPVYREETIRPDEVSSLAGPVLLEFGANWCGICQGFSPHLRNLLTLFPEVQHIRVEDGKGKPLGRSFRVKLWPTLVFIRDGKVVKQISRPSPADAQKGLEEITSLPTASTAPTSESGDTATGAPATGIAATGPTATSEDQATP